MKAIEALVVTVRVFWYLVRGKKMPFWMLKIWIGAMEDFIDKQGRSHAEVLLNPALITKVLDGRGKRRIAVWKVKAFAEAA